MQLFLDNKLEKKLVRWSVYLSVVVICIASVVLSGWVFDISSLKRPIPNLVAMNPTSAVAFIFSSGSLLLLTTKKISQPKRIAAYLLGVLALVIGTLKIIGVIFNFDWQIDQVLFAEKIKTEIAGNVSNRMAPNTAVCFLLTGVSLLLLKYNDRLIRLLSQFSALIIALLALLALIGYLYREKTSYGVLVYIPMAIHTSFCFLLLSISILFSTAGKGIIKELISPFAGGSIARVMIPVAIVVPIVLGFARLWGEWTGLFPLEMGVALLVLSIVIIFLIFIWFVASSLNKKDFLNKQIENALRESEEQMQTLFKTAPDAVVVIDQDGKIIKWNYQSELLFKWTESEVIGKLLSETIIPLRFREAHKKGLKHFLSTGEGPLLGKLVETNAVTKTGSEVDIALSIAPTKKIKNQTLFIGFVRDITEKKRAEQTLRESEEKFKGLLESAPDAMVIVNEEGKIILINQQTVNLFGYTKEELNNQKVEILVPGNFQDKHIQHRANYFKDPRIRVMGAGFELFALRKDGSQFPVEISLSPLQTTEGILVSAAIRDITERKKSNQLLRESEEKFQKAFQSSAAGITLTRLSDSKYRDVNDAFIKLTGYTKEEIIDHTSAELGIIVDFNKREEISEQIREKGFAKNFEITIMNKPGNKLEVLGAAETIELNGEKYAITIIYDITERKRAEEQLETANKELEAFSYSVSHDLRAPLRIIDGYAEILTTEYKVKLDEEGKRVLSVITENARKMGKLIDDLLNLSRMGRKEMIVQKVDMTRLVKSIIAENEFSKTKTEIIRIDKLEPAYCDSSLIRQVWINLISNAVKYTSGNKEPLIEINSTKEETEIIYSVKDNGVGFDMKYADKLFGVFQRLHKTTEYEGTGVGLALVHRIITRHRGRVWSEAEKDKGAVFYFSLPVRRNENN